MDIILKEDVQGLGRKGEVKGVKPGYFKNFLFPLGKAVVATEGRIKATEKLRAALVMEQEELAKKADEAAEKLGEISFEITAKASAKNKLFGAIDEKKVAALVKEQGKVEIETNQVEMEKHIKETGTHKVKLKLSPQVTQTITITVNPE